MRSSLSAWIGVVVVASAIASCRSLPKGVETNEEAVRAEKGGGNEKEIDSNAREMLAKGREIFRHDTFGSEDFWGGQLELHRAILGEKKGGVGPGLTPRQALQLGLKVDVGAVPKVLTEVFREASVGLDNPKTTLELLQAGAVVGVVGKFDKKGELVSVGITCAICHSTVNDSFMKGIGHRLDGWPNRDLDVGQVAALAPNLEPIAKILGTDQATVKKVLQSWGPGRFDAELNLDGKAFRPDGKSASTLIPAAFGMAGVNLHTYTGFGSVPYWNAFVANLEMYGRGVFYDPRFADARKFPVAAKNGFSDVRGGVFPSSASEGGEGRKEIDLVTSKLPALHFYQLSIPAPRPPKNSYDMAAAERGKEIFTGKAGCARCHVPPLFTEPGHALHTGAEIGIDDFQASRSPEGKYRTTPLGGLFTRAKGGFYHDGRFPDLPAVVDHYEKVLKLELTNTEKTELIEYLKSL